MQNTIKIIRESLLAARDSQGQRLYDEREIRSITSLLLEEVCGLSRVDCLMNPNRELDAEHRERLSQIAKQLSMGIPVQQALGYAWFADRKFVVSPDVLIPRPETAELIDWIVADHVQTSGSRRCDHVQTSGLRLCDVGTGSGCIAITLARLINMSRVLAIDISTAALSIARCNAYQQGVGNVQFVQNDILRLVDNSSDEDIVNNLSTACLQVVNNDCQQHSAGGYQQLSTGYPPFDVIVSNPPYICQQEAAEMSEIVKNHEPGLALFVPDDDPLLFYRAIARFALATLVAGGQLYFEINAAYGPETCQMLNEAGFVDVELRQDINGRDRMVRATLPK